MDQTKVVNMERRYRYPMLVGTRGKTNRFKALVKFFVGWQIAGLLIYRYMTRNVRKKDPDGPEAFDKKSAVERIRLMRGKSQDVAKARITFCSSGIQKELQIDENTTETYVLTMTGYKLVAKTVDKPQLELPNISNDRTELHEEEVEAEKPIPKTLDPPAGFSSSFYQSVISLPQSLLKWTSKKEKIDDS